MKWDIGNAIDARKRYVIEKKLGSGGMGDVFLVRDTKTTKTRVIKILKQEFTADKDFVERFMREANIVMDLNHPNIGRVFSYEEENDFCFILMPFYEGIELKNWLSQRKETCLKNSLPYNVNEALHITKQLCSGLHEAHSHGIIHRDIKPQNIMIDEKNHVNIVDFGIAKDHAVASELTDGNIMGTIAYMSPEQFSNSANVDQRADIYSTGIIFYQLLTGVKPPNVINRTKGEEPDLPSSLNKELSEAIDKIILRAIALDIDERFPSIKAFQDAIEKVTEGKEESVEEVKSEDLATEKPKFDIEPEKKYPIMFTDIKGSTSYYEKNGNEKGLALINRHNDLLFPIISRNRGYIVNTIGDAIMAVFPTPESAVKTAIAMQNALYVSNKNFSIEDKLPVRIGLNYGSFEIRDKDLLGEAVAIANSVEAYCEAGQILITDTLYQEIQRFGNECLCVGSISSKERSENIPVYSVVWANISRSQQIPSRTSWTEEVQSDASSTNKKLFPTVPGEKYSIMFTNLTKSKAYFEEYGNEKGMALIKRHNNLLLPLIEGNGGYVVKSLSGVIMAVFPTPDSSIQASITMQNALFYFNSRYTIAEKLDVEIGLNYGEFELKDNDLFGDAVNVAARVKAHAKPGQILISEDLHQTLTVFKDQCSYVDSFSCKGKSEKIPAYGVAWGDPLNMIHIPAGHFKMGSSSNESKHPAEYPKHLVYLDDFSIDKYPVTNSDYKEYVDATGAPEPLAWVNDKFNFADYPVTGISWEEAQSYANWKGKRLPTEAQWEKAARGPEGKGRLYPWGDEFIGDNANVDLRSSHVTSIKEFEHAHSYYGCVDMIGNACEWVSDWYSPQYYSIEEEYTNPKGPKSGDKKVLKGGCYNTFKKQCRAAVRIPEDPKKRVTYIGFRCAL